MTSAAVEVIEGGTYSKLSTYTSKEVVVVVTYMTQHEMLPILMLRFDRGLNIHLPPGIRFRRKQCFTDASHTRESFPFAALIIFVNDQL